MKYLIYILSSLLALSSLSSCMYGKLQVKHDTMKKHHIIMNKFKVSSVEDRYSSATIELLKFEKSGRSSDAIMKIVVTAMHYGFNQNFSSTHFGSRGILKSGEETFDITVYNRTTEKVLYRDDASSLFLNPGLNTNYLSGTIVINDKIANKIKNSKKLIIRLYDGPNSITLKFHEGKLQKLKEFVSFKTDPKMKYPSLQGDNNENFDSKEDW